MEVPSPSDGKVAAIEVSVGDKVKEGSPILQLEVSGGNGAEPAPGGAVAGTSIAAQESEKAAEIEEPKPIDTSEAPASPQVVTSEAPAYASPAVRRLARELGVDLSTVTGSGRKGRITKEDLQQAKDAPPASVDAAPASSGASASVGGLDLAPWPKVNFERFGEIERQPLTRIQKI